MAFDLETTDGKHEQYGDDASWSFTESGHLSITDSSGRRSILSHPAWTRLTIEPSSPTQSSDVTVVDGIV